MHRAFSLVFASIFIAGWGLLALGTTVNAGFFSSYFPITQLDSAVYKDHPARSFTVAATVDYSKKTAPQLHVNYTLHLEKIDPLVPAMEQGSAQDQRAFLSNIVVGS